MGKDTQTNKKITKCFNKMLKKKTKNRISDLKNFTELKFFRAKNIIKK